MMPLTPWVKRLLVANFIVYLLAPMVPGLSFSLAFRPDLGITVQQPWTLITYQFLHANFAHILFNMIALYFFGPRLEERMGGRHFLALYLLSGVGGGLLSLVFPDPMMRPIVGASGAVYGVLVAYAALWPRTVIHIWAILPIEAWALALIMVAVSLWSGFSGGGGNVAHFAHLGGLAVGFGYLKIWAWRLGAAKREFKRKLETPRDSVAGVGAVVSGEGTLMSRWEGIDTDSLHELNREEVEFLLDKARTLGVRALTPAERQFLDRMVQA